MNIIEEYKDELRRLRVQLSITHELLVDSEQFNRGIDRETAENNVSAEIFQRMQRAGEVGL